MGNSENVQEIVPKTSAPQLSSSTRHSLEVAASLYPQLPTELIKFILEFDQQKMFLSTRLTAHTGSRVCQGAFDCPQCQEHITFLYSQYSIATAEVEKLLPDIVRDHVLSHANCDIRIYNVAGQRMT
jgi:hypothetical protein